MPPITQNSPNLDGLVQVSKNISTQLGAINSTLIAIFPQATSLTSTTATGGSATLPTHPVLFLDVMINGTAYKVPAYLP